MIGKLNTRINIITSTPSQDAGGGLSEVRTDDYPLWAKVEARDGRMITGESQVQWSYNYKIIFRYEKSRPVSSGQTIEYDGKRLMIHSISYEDEGKRRYCIARCSVTRK